MMKLSPWQYKISNFICPYNYHTSTVTSIGACEALCDATNGCAMWTLKNNECRYAKDDKGCCAGAGSATSFKAYTATQMPNSFGEVGTAATALRNTRISNDKWKQRRGSGESGCCWYGPSYCYSCCSWYNRCGSKYTNNWHCSCPATPSHQSFKDQVIQSHCIVGTGGSGTFGFKGAYMFLVFSLSLSLILICSIDRAINLPRLHTRITPAPPSQHLTHLPFSVIDPARPSPQSTIRRRKVIARKGEREERRM